MNFDARLLRNIDYWLLLAVAALIAIGMVVIDSASRGSGLSDIHAFMYKQALAVAAGLIATVVLLMFDYSEFGRMSTPLYILNCTLLTLVLVIGRVSNAQQGWIGFGSFHLEPSEVGKVLFIMTLAHHLAKAEHLDGWLDLVPPILHLAPLLGLIMLQPDLGTGLVFIVVLGAMLYMAGVSGWRLFLVGGAPVMTAITWVVLHVKYGLWIPFKSYQVKRFLVFADPSLDPLGSGYQVLQSKIAIGSGGAWGRGLYQGTQTQLGFLPEQHTDFIFAVVGEELGFAGGVAILLLFLLLLTRVMIVAASSKDRYGMLLATGVAAMIGFHVLENIGMTIGLMPVTGIPLPFVSYGGSSMLANLMAVAVVQNVYMRRQKIMF